MKKEYNLQCYATRTIVGRKHGFTLIELLVVISIIALLLAILMPALQRVRQEARAVVCQAHLREWGLAIKMYADDNNGYFMKGGTGAQWFKTLEPYYTDKNLILCVEATKPATAPSSSPTGGDYLFGSTRKAWSYGGHLGSYGLNMWVLNRPPGESLWGRGPTEQCWRTPYVKKANNIPVFADCTWAGTQPKYCDEPPQYEGDPSASYLARFCIDRHNGYINGCFCDFSVREIGLKELWRLKWHRNFDVTADRPVWPRWMRNLKDY